MKRTKSNDATWKILVSVSSKSGKLTAFNNLDLTPFGGRLINLLTTDATRKLKLNSNSMRLAVTLFFQTYNNSKNQAEQFNLEKSSFF